MADVDADPFVEQDSAETRSLKKWLKCEFLAVNHQTQRNEGLLNDIKDRIEQLESENLYTQNLCEGLQRENQELKATVDDLNQKVLQLEFSTRKDNLRFFNIHETHSRSTEEELRDFIRRHLHLNEEIQFSTVYRVGPSNDKRPRCIVGRFTRRSDCERVKAAARNLKGTRYGIAEDLPPEWAELRRLAHPIHVKPARQEGKQVRWRGPRLFIDGQEVMMSLSELRKSKRAPPPPSPPARPRPSSIEPSGPQSPAPPSDSGRESPQPSTSTMPPPREQRQQSRGRKRHGKGKQQMAASGRTKPNQQVRPIDRSESRSSSNSGSNSDITLTQSGANLASRLRILAGTTRYHHDEDETVSEPEMDTSNKAGSRPARSTPGVSTRSQTQMGRFFKAK